MHFARARATKRLRPAFGDRVLDVPLAEGCVASGRVGAQVDPWVTNKTRGVRSRTDKHV